MAKVSVIIPTYNVQKYIAACLDSVLAQTEKDLEIIVVDDKSCDKTVKIVNQYQEKYPNKIKLLVQKEKHGAGGARNQGLKIASGKYIGFIDGDDLVKPRMYEELANGLAYDSNIQIARTNAVLFKQDAKLLLNKTCCYGKGSIISPYREGNQKILYWCDPACWNKLFRRELLEDFAFPEGIIFEDYAFTYPLYIKANRVIHFQSENYLYRQNEEGVSHSVYEANLKVLDGFKAADFLLENAKKLPRAPLFQEEMRALSEQLLLTRILEVEKWNIEDPEKQEIMLLFDDLIREKYGDWEEMSSHAKDSFQVRLGVEHFKSLGLYGREKRKETTLEGTYKTLEKKIRDVAC